MGSCWLTVRPMRFRPISASSTPTSEPNDANHSAPRRGAGTAGPGGAGAAGAGPVRQGGAFASPDRGTGREFPAAPHRRSRGRLRPDGGPARYRPAGRGRAPARAKGAAERVVEHYPRLKERRRQRAGTLSGGERRMLEIARALVMEPQILLVDEPSIGLEPRYIGMVFEVLEDLQRQGKTIVMVEQNAKKGLQFSDIGYVLVSGEIAMAGTGDDLLRDPEVGRLFLGA